MSDLITFQIIYDYEDGKRSRDKSNYNRTSKTNKNNFILSTLPYTIW